jgi:hypothetical protein
MKQMIECGTCGYPLLPEERTGMVEVNGKALNPWKGLTDEDVYSIIEDNVPPKLNNLFDMAKWVSEVVEAKLKEKNHG